MKLTAVRFKPKSSFHLGTREKWKETTDVFPRSDTLFSAFCHCYLLLYGKEKLESLLKKFISSPEPPFLISSVFPCYKSTFYFPAPLSFIPYKKELKKIKWFSKEELENHLKDPEYFHHNSLTPKEMFYKVEYAPGVGLSRLNYRPEKRFFHSGIVFYKREVELFFLIKFNDFQLEKEVNAVWNLLADEGIGGDRSTGKGFFEKPVIEKIEINVPSQANGIYSLSLYYPDIKRDELNGIEKGFYSLLERKGYIFSMGGKPYRRRSIRVFAEGSVFPSIPAKRGLLVDITPGVYSLHRVYRYGFILSLPCNLPKEH